MKTRKIVGYAQPPVKVSRMANAYPGISIHLCSATWRRTMCHGQCCMLIPDGAIYRDRFLAKALKKPESKLTWKDKTDRKDQLERAAFKKCRQVTFTTSD
jgi:hypothetical protein